MSSAKVIITEDGSVPIPPEIQTEAGLKPHQSVTVRVDDRERIIVEKPSREEIVAEIERLCAELRTGEPLSQIWAEIEQERNHER